MSSEPSYWFRAKRYGWGWGLPLTWQGWLALLGYLALVVLSGLVFPPAARPFGYGASVVVLSLALVAICYAKGEPPRWRWGRR